MGPTFRKLAGRCIAVALAFASAGLVLTGPAGAQQPSASWQEVADRIAIEDLLVRYYGHLGGGDADAFVAYFTEDAVFEVNGDVYHGRDAILDLYRSMGGGVSEGADAGMFHMVLSNALVDVEGDTAYASMLWTGVVNGDPQGAPTLREQGREYDLLVRENGAWKIWHRVVIADSGLRASMRDTWQREPGLNLRSRR